MSKTLVVVESPAKAKTIGKFLGAKYSVKASMGHVRDLPKSQLGVEIDDDLKVKYINIRGKGDLIKELKNTAQKSERVLLATDPDREGEAIAWHLKDLLKIPENQDCRVVFNEITKNTIKEAIKKPRQIDLRLVDAQQARRVLDRIVGYKLSPLLWRKIKRGLSAGRVQSVVVRLICDREDEIKAFVPEEFWSLTAALKKDKVNFEAKLVKVGGKKAALKNETQVNDIIKDIGENSLTVVSVKKRQQKRNPSAPFTTSSLQQEAYRKLNFGAKKTMLIAQQLYEGLDLSKEEGTVGLITYIRTDSTRVSDEAKKEAADYISAAYGEEYLPGTARVYLNKGKSQDAHECIRPSSASRHPDAVRQYLTKDQHKLYKLVFERFISSQMASALLEITTADLKVKKYDFRAGGSLLVFPGFMKIYVEGKDNQEKEEEGLIPALTAEDVLEILKLLPKQHFTQPPPRYSEASLIKTLEENGIGRPSTYAPVLDTIVTRGYVLKKQKQYSPTELGYLIVELLKKYFKDVIDVEFTAKMENSLDSIEEGAADWKRALLEFYHPFMAELDTAEREIGQITVMDEITEEKCELCGRNMVIKSGRFGKFLACPGFPDCRQTRPILEETGAECPKCEDGKVVVRWTKKGRKFFGCSKFPKCDFVSWDEPAKQKCPQCGSMMLQKKARKNEAKLICSQEKCGHSQACETIEEQTGE